MQFVTLYQLQSTISTVLSLGNIHIAYTVVLFTIILFLVVSQAYPVFTGEDDVSFQSDDGFQYSIDGDSRKIAGYDGTGRVLRIPDEIAGLPVTQIGENAFLHNRSIWSAILPDTLFVIEPYAFDDSSLRCIVLPDGLQTIGDAAFSGSNLTSIHIPASVTAVGRAAFHSCRHLRSVCFNASDIILRDRMFFECINLYDISLSDTIKVIEEEAFYFCTSLEIVNLPISLETIEDHAFFDCRMLKITVDDSVRLGESVFFICDPSEYDN